MEAKTGVAETSISKTGVAETSVAKAIAVAIVGIGIGIGISLSGSKSQAADLKRKLINVAEDVKLTRSKAILSYHNNKSEHLSCLTVKRRMISLWACGPLIPE